MIRFTCPQCEKMLRADDTEAGSPANCPGCGHKLTIPDTEAEPPPPDDEGPERPAPRKQRRPRLRARNSLARRGKVLVIFICCLVLGMHLVPLIWYLATHGPMTTAKKQTHELYQQPGKDPPRDFEQTREQGSDQLMRGKEVEAPRRPIRMSNLMWMLGSFCLVAVPFTFLYLRHDWARLLLGVLFLTSVGCGIFGIVTGVPAVRLSSAGAPVLAALEFLARIGVNLGIGLTLLQSRSIAAYTGGR